MDSYNTGVLFYIDPGRGFTVDDIPRIETPLDLLREHGRGIRLMQEWLDELAYFRGGRLASLSRRRADHIYTQVSCPARRC